MTLKKFANKNLFNINKAPYRPSNDAPSVISFILLLFIIKNQKPYKKGLFNYSAT